MRDKYTDDEGRDYVLCPLVDEHIEAIECLECRDVVDRLIMETSIPEKYKSKKNWKSLCTECKWHNY